MTSVRLIGSLSWLLALAACKRPSEPPPGPGTHSPSAQPSPSASAPAGPAALAHRSVHDRDMPDQPPPRPASDQAKVIKASHILIAYKGALDAAPSVTRDKPAAEKLAKFVGVEARAGANFEGLVAKYSDDPQAKANEGQLGAITRTQMEKPFTDAAFELMVKEITAAPVETP